MIDFMYQSDPVIFAYRRYTDKDQIIVINNFSNEKKQLDCVFDRNQYKLLLSNYTLHQQKEGKIILQPYETLVYERM